MIQMLVYFSTSSLGILTFHRTSDKNVLRILSVSKYQNPSCETIIQCFKEIDKSRSESIFSIIFTLVMGEKGVVS